METLDLEETITPTTSPETDRPPPTPATPPAPSQPEPPPAEPNHPKISIWWCLLGGLVIAAGVAIRLRFYLYNRSMYRDEAALALNIVNRTWGGLFKPLDNDQGAPIGFLVLEKLVVRFWGDHEKALRLVPQIFSILTLPVFFWLCRKLLLPGAAIIALVIVALGAKQYDYSTDTKQYALDVFCAVLLFLLATLAVGGLYKPPDPAAPPRKCRLRWTIALGIAGTLAIWFSHPATFILGGVGVMLAIEWLRPRPLGNPLGFAALAIAWAASFAANYHWILTRLSHDDYMLWFWSKADAFAPVPKSIAAITWYKQTFFEVFANPCSLDFVGLCALVFLLGVWVLWRRRLSLAIMLLLPIFLALAASALQKYPFKERLILFICPSLAIFIGAGFEYLFQQPRRAVGIIALTFVLITPIDTVRKFAIKPWLHSDMRTVISLVGRNQQPGDELYIDEACWYPYEYYRGRFGIEKLPATQEKTAVADIDEYRKIFAAYRGKRVWIMYEGEAGPPPQQQWATIVLDEMGKRVFETSPMNDYVACYDLR
jgi:hypothetical protein